MSEQLELGIERRPRVALVDAGQQGSVTKKKRTRVIVLTGLLEYEAEQKAGYSPWLRGLPPCSGWWDIHLLGTDEYYRIWFDADAVRWVLPTASFSHDSIGQGLEYRGLANPWVLGYSYPVKVPHPREFRPRVGLVD